jgi:hypothetical protein
VRILAVLGVSIDLAGLAAGQRRPRFDSYPASVEKARIKKIDFKRNPDAYSMRTRLTHALRGGVNFAGRYIITGWGCGTGCINGAVIDTRSGKIYWPGIFVNIDTSYGDEYAERPLEFKNNSRLLIIHGRPGTPDADGPSQPIGDHYYEWVNGRFRHLTSRPKALIPKE